MASMSILVFLINSWPVIIIISSYRATFRIYRATIYCGTTNHCTLQNARVKMPIEGSSPSGDEAECSGVRAGGNA